MLYRRKKKGFFYYFKVLFYSAVTGCALFCLYQQEGKKLGLFDADKILAQSVLQNKTFSAQVKEIEEAGIKAYLMEEHSNPIISIDFEFQNSGYAHDKKWKYGLAKIASSLIMDGAGRFDDKALLDLMEENGIKIGFNASKDSFSGSLITPKANFKTAQSLLKQIMFSPRLPLKHLAITKAQMLKALQLQNENPGSVLSLAFNEQIYGSHPYGRNPLGRKEDIESISKDDIVEYLERTFTKQNLIIGIAGDISEDESKSFIKNIFGSIPEESAQKPLEEFEYASQGKEHHIEREMPQVIAVFSVKGTHRESPDFYPLYLANYIFGESGLTSRLNKVLREDNGLTYGIFTTLSNNASSAFINGNFSASAENYDKAKELLLSQWQKMAKEGVSSYELEKAKKSLIDSFNLRFADIEGLSAMLLAMQKYNLGLDFLQKRNDYIKNLTIKEVNEAAKKYYSATPDFVTIGPKRKEK